MPVADECGGIRTPGRQRIESLASRSGLASQALADFGINLRPNSVTHKPAAVLGNLSEVHENINAADILVEFLRLSAARTFIYGQWDCGRFVARWVAIKRGVEPGVEFAGRYSTRLGLARLLKRRGGLVTHFDLCLSAIGIARTDNPMCGDVSVIDAPEGPTGAIMLSGTLSACLSEAGFRVRQLPVLAAWRV